MRTASLLYFELACSLFERGDGYPISEPIGEKAPPALERYNDIENQGWMPSDDTIAEHLRQGLGLDTTHLKETLLTHLTSRLDKIDTDIAWVGEMLSGFSADAVIRLTQVHEEALPDSLPLLLAARLKYGVADLGKWRQAVDRMRALDNELELFAAFADIEDEFEPLEILVDKVRFTLWSAVSEVAAWADRAPVSGWNRRSNARSLATDVEATVAVCGPEFARLFKDAGAAVVSALNQLAGSQPATRVADVAAKLERAASATARTVPVSVLRRPATAFRAGHTTQVLRLTTPTAKKAAAIRKYRLPGRSSHSHTPVGPSDPGSASRAFRPRGRLRSLSRLPRPARTAAPPCRRPVSSAMPNATWIAPDGWFEWPATSSSTVIETMPATKHTPAVNAQASARTM
ncbi:hypothetical protein [Dactylosporangium fulvum]|uniref:Uncharacterized protein n=1 Tax=Dactylosporangium fulvum TaxID=53359 RepID=A0ABY5W8F8_9ACTN|nr:hypothetical protein [Dactylosporangium fulvum]UWP85650.1 hypothetical protein Dfulv_15950 [Dactylosporangium fulvum]